MRGTIFMDKYGEPDWKDNTHLGDIWRVRYDLARDKTTFPGILEELVYDTQWQVREAATLNPKTDTVVLIELASHSSWVVRENVAKNPSTPDWVLEALSDDPSESVKTVARYRRENKSSAETVANNPNPARRSERTMENDVDNLVNLAETGGGIITFLRWVFGLILR